MPVPKQVREQSEAVKAFYEEVGGDGTPAPNPSAELVIPPVVTPVQSQEPPIAPIVPPDQNDELMKWQQKYASLQGKYNAEMPRLHQQVRDLSGKITTLEGLLANVASIPAPSSTPVVPPTPATQSVLTDQEVAEYGDTIPVIQKLARAEADRVYAPIITRLEEQLKSLTGVVPQVQAIREHQAMTTEQLFWDALDRDADIAGWRTVNDDPEFIMWLAETDPLTGITRQAYLDDAQAKLNAYRVIAFFKEWAKISGTARPPVNSHVPPTLNPELAAQVVPGRGRSTTATTSNEPRKYTLADIQKFYSDVARGHYRGKEAEKAKTEQDIFAAQKEGRVVPT